VIGDSLFMGGAIADPLIKRGDQVVLYDTDSSSGLSKTIPFFIGGFSNEYALRSVMSSHSPDVVLFMVPKLYSPTGDYKPIEEFKSYCDSLNVLCSVLDSFDIKHVYLRSSFEVYGPIKKNNPKALVKESDYCHPVSYRGALLSYAENALRIHCFNTSTKFTSLRFFDVYGEDGSRVPGGLLSSVLKSVGSGGTAGVRGVNTWSDFIHVSDAVQAVVSVIDAGIVGPINIGTGRASKIKRLVSKVRAVSSRKNCIIPIEDQFFPTFSAVANISRLSEVYTPTIKWEDELERLFLFYGSGGSV